jgi:hypothetical protein
MRITATERSCEDEPPIDRIALLQDVVETALHQSESMELWNAKTKTPGALRYNAEKYSVSPESRYCLFEGLSFEKMTWLKPKDLPRMEEIVWQIMLR